MSQGLTRAPIVIQERPDFGRYRLCAELASGGMGNVYAARAIGPGGFHKRVALKRIHAHLANDERFVAMFLDEARLAARIQHPNVAGVIDFGQVDGSYYLAMPFVFGEPLSRVFRRVSKLGPEALARFRWNALKLLADACEGLHAAHELRDDDGLALDVVHRDVSPANMLVGYDGSLRVIDFGVASARQRLYRTETGEIKGKLGYGAPEQLAGEKVDRRADVWSLGVVLWEALAGRRLFRRDSLGQTVMAVSTAPIPALRDFWEDAPLELEEVVFKALSRDPERRYGSARALGRALLEILNEEKKLITTADIAEWMETLFPQGEEQLRALVESSSGVVSPEELEAAGAPAITANDQGVGDAQRAEHASSAEHALTAKDALSADHVPGADAPGTDASTRVSGKHPAVVRPEEARSRSRWAAALVLFGALALGGGIAFFAPGEVSEPEDAPPASGGDDAASPGPAAGPPSEALEAIGPSPGAPSGSERRAADEPTGGGAPSRSDEDDGTASNTATLEEPGADGEDGEGIAAVPPVAPMLARRPVVRRAGEVVVTVAGGWAVVYLGNRRLGDAPGRWSLPAGRHTLRIQRDGEGPRMRRRVVVRPGQSTTVRVR